jgi:hypothetical protein
MKLLDETLMGRRILNAGLGCRSSTRQFTILFFLPPIQKELNPNGQLGKAATGHKSAFNEVSLAISLIDPSPSDTAISKRSELA